MDILPRTACRSCAAPLAPVLALGPTYLSDFPRSAGTKAHPPIPLDLMRCTSPACGLVQLAHTTPRDWMFRTYWYRSGVNEAMQAELKDVVDQAIARVDLQRGDMVVDIGANDGTLLKHFADRHVTRVAYEPAANLYDILRPHAEVLIPDYFAVEGDPDAVSTGLQTFSGDLRQDQAEQREVLARDEGGESRGITTKLIFCIACFYDLDSPHDFLEHVTRILHPEGVFVVQQAYLLRMLQNTAFDNIVHEHLEYYDLHSLEAVLAPHGLEVFSVAKRTINGGSFRTFIGFQGAHRVDPSVEYMHLLEKHFYADRPKVFSAFAHRVARVKAQLGALLQAYADQQSPVDLYAASTKSNTLLQYCGVDARVIRQAWERSPEKRGRYVGVSAIPIVSEADGRKDPPAALLVGAWQWKDYFLERERDYLQAGGRMIFPLPYVETVTQVQHSTSVKEAQ